MNGPAYGRDVRMVVVLGLAGAIGLGIGRFGYALVLPDMRESLDWSYADAGLMNTINAAGYLLGALSAAAVVRALGSFRSLFFGALGCVIALAVCALSGDFLLLGAARFLAGLAAAYGFVSGGVMASAIAERQPQRGAYLLTLFYIGPGIGILLSGLIVPLLLDRLGPGSWPSAWLALAGLALLLTGLLLLARRATVVTARSRQQGRTPLRPMLPLLVAYLVFGAGYIGYMTFMVAWVRTQGGAAPLQALFWSAIGLGAIVSPWVWSPVIAKLGGGKAFAALAVASLFAAALPLASEASAALLFSALVFGGGLISVVTSTTAFVRRNYASGQWPAAIGAMTTAFGLGQVLGPVATGFVTDLVGGLAAGLWVSAGLLALSVFIALLQRDLAQAPA